MLWTQSDEDIPRGDIGEVVRLDDHKLSIQWPKGLRAKGHRNAIEIGAEDVFIKLFLGTRTRVTLASLTTWQNLEQVLKVGLGLKLLATIGPTEIFCTKSRTLEYEDQRDSEVPISERRSCAVDQIGR